MSTHPFPDPGSSLPPEPERKPRGCLFYGCITAIVIGVLVLLLVGLGSWGAYRAASQFVEQYADDKPAPIPVAERPAAEVEALGDRIDAFGDALSAGTATEPLSLTSDEINALIAAVPELRGVIAIELVGDKVRGQLSFPVERLGFPIGTLFPGKYLNGTATIDARFVDGRPFLAILDLEAKGKPVPETFLGAIRGQNLATGLDDDPKIAKALRRLESATVKDGKLILTPRPPGKPTGPAEPPSDKPTEPAEPPDGAKPADPPKAPQ